jgi:hypothetical protein
MSHILISINKNRVNKLAQFSMESLENKKLINHIIKWEVVDSNSNKLKKNSNNFIIEDYYGKIESSINCIHREKCKLKNKWKSACLHLK